MKQETKEVGFVEIDENDVEEILAPGDQDLTKELMQLQEPKIQMETKYHSKQPKGNSSRN